MAATLAPAWSSVGEGPSAQLAVSINAALVFVHTHPGYMQIGLEQAQPLFYLQMPACLPKRNSRTCSYMGSSPAGFTLVQTAQHSSCTAQDSTALAVVPSIASS